MNLKLRLNLMITALLGLLMLIGILLLIHNARAQVRAEIESTAALAGHLLDAETIYFSGVLNQKTEQKPSHLRGLDHLRHLRIEYRDNRGRLVDSNQVQQPQADADLPPYWFMRAMTVALPQPLEVRRPLVINGQPLGELAITPDPSYEVAEIWRDTVDLLILVSIFFVTVNLMVYWAVGRALRPVDRILGALTELEEGRLDSRLPEFDLPELSRISSKFNGMAQKLQQSISRNHKLSQQLIQLQEEERKSLARDLHDELGQYLTAIRTDAAALLEMSKTRFPEAREGAQAIVDVTLQVMHIIGAILQRLRPEVLDQLGLRPSLIELIATWRQRNQNVSCILKLPENINTPDEQVSLTAYRVVQECLTNVARHAQARRVEIELRLFRDGRLGKCLEINVSDDGTGFDPETPEGFGLCGMRERVEGLGGTLAVDSAPQAGTRIRAILPIAAKEQP